MIFAAGATGVGTSVAISSPSPWVWLIPVACGVAGALLVRGVTMTTPSKKKKVWKFEALVTLVVVLLTAVVVEEKALTPMWSVIYGMGFGSTGVGVITLARNMAIAGLKEALGMVDPSK